jgi:hypothetical protein
MSNAATPTVFIDINGPAEPNIAGLDAFVLHITNEGEITDIITDESACNKKSSPGSSISSYASGCLTKVMNNGWKVTD